MQINIVLELANKAARTNFALGYITDGWHGKVNKKTKVWDNDFVRRPMASVAGDILAGSEPKPAQPVIWIWNDNSLQRRQAWGER